MHFRGRSAGLKWAEDYDMSKMEQIKFQLAAAASEVPRDRSSVGNSMFPPKQRSMRRSEPLFDGDRKVIAFPAQDISAQAPGLRSRDATGDVKIAHFRRRPHASPSSKRAAKSREGEFWEKQAATQNDDDHHHRMLENLVGAAALILLIIAGNWILSTLVKMP
jgi:hypothetical protein